jgi:hypothetical protein
VGWVEGEGEHVWMTVRANCASESETYKFDVFSEQTLTEVGKLRKSARAKSTVAPSARLTSPRWSRGQRAHQALRVIF